MNTSTIRDSIAAEVRADLARKQMPAAELSRGTGISTAALTRKLRGETSFTVEELLAVSRSTGTAADSYIAAAIRPEPAAKVPA